MKIKLDERYRIDQVQYGYSLVDTEGRTTKNKDTDKLEFTDNVIGYFGSVAQACERYIRLITDQPNKVLTIREYIDSYKSTYEKVIGILPKVKG